MKGILQKYFNNLYDSKKISHAFLICNTSYDDIKEELQESISKYVFEEEIKIDNDEDIVIISPELNT
ncbi:hypothetical protein EOM09_02910, partial [bacterium]|nr:hypothetical protein [bacterium]